MKTVVLNTPVEEIVSVKNVSNKKCYGMTYQSGTRKAFVTRRGFESGKFVSLSKHNITNGNFHSEGNSLNDLITYHLNCDRTTKVYEFDTAKELFSWLAED